MSVGKFPIMFSCKGCGLVDCRVKVRVRYLGEEVLKWIELVVMPAVGSYHHFCSPTCHSEVCDLKIPIKRGTEKGIGEEPPD